MHLRLELCTLDLKSVAKEMLFLKGYDNILLNISFLKNLCCFCYLFQINWTSTELNVEYDCSLKNTDCT